MLPSIPANQVVNVVPNVLSAGGQGLDVIGLMLTDSLRPPTGQILSFPDLDSVEDYFGSTSEEADFAAKYFRGYEGRTVSPEALLITKYNAAAISGFLRGGDISGLTLTQLQAITPGTLTITFGGSALTSSSINLSAATSFSNAATIIQAAFTTPPFAVSYDSTSGAFVFTSTATGAAATIIYPANTIATALLLTEATGAVLSQGADAVTPAAFMDDVIEITQDWVTFTTLFNPDVSGFANKLAFANWNNAQLDQFAYVPFDSDVTPTNTLPATGSFGFALATAEVSGTCPIWAPDETTGYQKAAFVMGTAASINFERTNGRITFKFRNQAGMVGDVTNATVATNLAGNGYNFYGAYATRSQSFNFFANGVVSGKFDWFDTYINQIQLNNALQQAILLGLTQVGSIPYNSRGYAMIEAFCMDPINSALNFGSIRPGVPLSSAQIAEVNEAAGADIANTLQTRGWYLQIKAASPQVRANRESPPCTLWYMDGGSVQKIDLASIAVQ